MANVVLGVDGSYTSFSGADAVASFGGVIVGELQALTINVQREKGPIYVMGSANPISFSRGKRGIAGNLVFIQFDRNALMETMEARAKQFGTIPQYTAAGNMVSTQQYSVQAVTNPNTMYTNLPINSQFNNLTSVVAFGAANQAQANAYNEPFVQLHGSQAGEFWNYDDEIPPFDITVTFANEYGNAANLVVSGVEILNFGMGVSIDDINLENAMTFIARRMQRLRPGFNNAGTANTVAPISQSLGGTTLNNSGLIA